MKVGGFSGIAWGLRPRAGSLRRRFALEVERGGWVSKLGRSKIFVACLDGKIRGGQEKSM